ncbi:hypothetical protein C5167_000136 [Papaver somniferum]|uniref:Uncharacterized protein n=1 Tax=Papaver somniferum TaxID=3469 RepID=A0A4Y7KT82_PAPSO|nr:hypothetical protein C5167_000136 [Papaver somniferum]
MWSKTSCANLIDFGYKPSPNCPADVPKREDCWDDLDYWKKDGRQLLAPAVKETMNVLKAAKECGVKRAVLT